MQYCWLVKETYNPLVCWSLFKTNITILVDTRNAVATIDLDVVKNCFSIAHFPETSNYLRSWVAGSQISPLLPCGAHHTVHQLESCQLSFRSAGRSTGGIQKTGQPGGCREVVWERTGPGQQPQQEAIGKAAQPAGTGGAHNAGSCWASAWLCPLSGGWIGEFLKQPCSSQSRGLTSLFTT